MESVIYFKFNYIYDSAYRFEVGKRFSVGDAIRAKLSDLLPNGSLPFGVQSQEHQAPGGSNSSGFMSSEVNVLAVIHYESLGEILPCALVVAGGCLQQ